MADGGRGYDAFISYRRSDGTRAARRLRQMLRAYRLPRRLRAGRAERLTVFLDTVYERGASDFYEKTIAPALLASRFLIVVATPDAIRRTQGEDWIQREVADFSAGPNAGNVIVVRALGEFMDRLPADIGERYPNVQIVDLRDIGWLSALSPQRAARIADEKLKIVGPLFDIPLEEMPVLRREEERQQMGRLGGMAGAATATVALVAGLSLFALRSDWEGQQALVQSLRVTQDSIAGIVEQYDSDEGLQSMARELVLRNCDVATQMAQLSGTPTRIETDIACAIEEGLAIGRARDPAEGSTALAAALGRAEAAYLEATEPPDRFLSILRAGMQTALRFEGELNPAGVAAALDRHMAFERRVAARFADRPDRVRDGSRLQSAYAHQLAYLAASEAAGSFASGDNVRAAALYAEARGDAAAAMRLTAALIEGADASPVDRRMWIAYARDYHRFAIDFATVAPDRAAGRQAVDEAIAAIAAAPKADWNAHASAAMLAGLRGKLAELNAADGQEATARGEAFACLDAAASAMAEIGGSERAEPLRPDEAVADLAREATAGCISTMVEQVNARRARVNDLRDKGDAASARDALLALISDSRRIDGYREEAGDWDRFYLFVALRDLAALHAALGDDDAAEAARIEAVDLAGADLGDLAALDITAQQSRMVSAAWDEIWEGHYARTDRYGRDGWNAPPAEAVALLEKLLAEDDAWDRKMPRIREWDDVYQAEVRLRLAQSKRALGDEAGHDAQMDEALRRVAKYGGEFTLTGGERDRALAVWEALKDWRRDEAKQSAQPEARP